MERGKNLDVAKEKHEVISYCNDDISKVYSKEGILSKPFNFCELNSPNKTHVHLRAYVDFFGGYAAHGRAVLFGLHNSGEIIVKLTPITSMVDIDPITHQKCTFLTRTPAFEVDKSIFLTIAGPGWSQEQFLPKNRYSITWTMIESLCCNPKMKEWLDKSNEIWAPTWTDVKRFNQLELKNVKRMQLGYDETLYHPEVAPIDIVEVRGRYVFMVHGSWNKRKGIKTIIDAFCIAFDAKDPVSLVLVCKYGTRPYDGMKDGELVKKEDKEKWDINYEFKRIMKTWENNNPPHIVLCDRPIHENVLPNVCARADCIVGASLGESTWLPGLEFGALGKPVIQVASECCGFMDYLDHDNSYLCNHSGKEVQYIEADEELYKGTSDYYEGQKFAETDPAYLADMMLRVYKERNADHQKYKIRRLQERLKDWTWKKSIKAVIQRLKETK